MANYISNRLRHFFYVVSNVRPIVWICLYVGLIPIFALIYHWLPDGQFRIPDDAGVDYGSWLYYSIVTITTLGFGDYTPAHAWAQAFTAIEVGCGMLTIGFFLNAVGSMKSEIDIDAEVEKQRHLHEAEERDKLRKSLPMVMSNINRYLERCTASEAASDGVAKRRELTAVLKAGSRTALCLDSLQSRVDLTLWPTLLENCFSFVADYQMYSAEDESAEESNLREFINRTKGFAEAIVEECTRL